MAHLLLVYVIVFVLVWVCIIRFEGKKNNFKWLSYYV